MVYATAIVCLWLFGRFATVPQLNSDCGNDCGNLPQSLPQ